MHDQPHSALRDAQIDVALRSEAELLPSSGFLSAVMERVAEEACAPEPIPFPWKRVLPGLLLLVGVTGYAFWKLGPLLKTLPGALRQAGSTTAILPEAWMQEAAWTVGSLCCVLLILRFFGRMGERGVL